MGGVLQIVRLPRLSGVCVHGEGQEELLPQRRLLRQYAVVGKDLQIFNVNLVVHHLPSLKMA